MLDENFERTVVLMAQHGEEGALGFVINRPSSIDLETLLENVDEDLAKQVRGGPLASHEVLVGGPVQQEAVWLLFEHEEVPEEIAEREELIPVGDKLAVGATLTLLLSFLSGERTGRFLVLLGYSGWGPGQLEEEIKTGTWLPAGVDRKLVLELEHEEKWAASLRQLGLVPGGFMISGSGALA